jgi:GDP-D-mannose dehydratase
MSELMPNVLAYPAGSNVPKMRDQLAMLSGTRSDNLSSRCGVIELDHHQAEFFRPAEIDMLLGNFAKANAELGWQARATLEEMIHEMVDANPVRIHREMS